jgi:hypothetical protein
MDAECIKLLLLSAEAAREKAKRTYARNARYAEFNRFYTGGMMVFTGYLLAAIYVLTSRMLN